MAGVRLVSFTPHCTTRNGMKIAPSCAPLFLVLGLLKCVSPALLPMTYTLTFLRFLPPAPPFWHLPLAKLSGSGAPPTVSTNSAPSLSLTLPLTLCTPATHCIHSLLNKSPPPFSPR